MLDNIKRTLKKGCKEFAKNTDLVVGLRTMLNIVENIEQEGVYLDDYKQIRKTVESLTSDLDLAKRYFITSELQEILKYIRY